MQVNEDDKIIDNELSSLLFSVNFFISVILFIPNFFDLLTFFISLVQVYNGLF